MTMNGNPTAPNPVRLGLRSAMVVKPIGENFAP